MKRNPDLGTVKLEHLSNKTRISILWKIVTNKSVKANKMAKYLLRTKVQQENNENGRSTRNSLYRSLMRIEPLRGQGRTQSVWTSVEVGCGSWFVWLVMACCWWRRSFASVDYAPFASGGDH